MTDGASPLETAAAVILGLAVAHTFAAGRIRRLDAGLARVLGEVELVFALWAVVLVAAIAILAGPRAAADYVAGVDFTEPLFVLAILAVASTRPIVQLAERAILGAARLLPIRRELAAYVGCLAIGPLLGSLITEPAAMTVTALILRSRYFTDRASDRLRYATLAVLFVNVSIGGVLTPFAAPPVLLVAGRWGWDLSFMLAIFGWKAAIACLLNATLAAALSRRELIELEAGAPLPLAAARSPAWLIAAHLGFLAAIVVQAHHPARFLSALASFLGFAWFTRARQDALKLRESAGVALFLAGLVTLGGPQSWWITPLIQGLGDLPLFLGVTALTAFTDNAALTYLGAQVPGISDGFKIALVSGAVAGGGLTVIANAPNPAGLTLLQDRFGESGIQPLPLALAALIPTGIAMACLWWL